MARPTHRSGNLPAEATSFIGRRRELAEIRKKLSTARLVSLVGPGGVGKTRLAIRIAAELRRGFRDGAWLVELANVQRPALVANAALAALQLRDQTATEPLALVLAHLRDKQLLLVLDNCEHVLEAAAQLLAQIIEGAPGVRVIATSREPLSVLGEHVLPVPPLELPSAEACQSLGQLQQNEAVVLFTERAVAASGTFTLTTSNEAAVIDICRRLDGVPLAIELAAVKTRVLSAEQIVDHLTDRFRLLTGGTRAALPRHQTLRTAIDWSYDLLAPGERMLLRRLCVFAGSFTLEDVESVCTSDELRAVDVLDLLSSVVDKSLVVKEDTKRDARYRLHETMREYAHLELREAGEEDAVELRCTEYYLSRCQRSAVDARYHLLQWLEWTDLEIENLRSVLRRCLNYGDFQRGLGLATCLGWYWVTRATTEGVRWLDELLAPDVHARAHAWTYLIRGFLAVLQGDANAARPALERAVIEARATGQLSALSEALSMASIAAHMAGDRTGARHLLDDAQTITNKTDDPADIVGLLQARTLAGFFAGDLDLVRSASSEGARISREVGDLYSLDMMLMNLGSAALIAGEVEESKPLFSEALGIARQLDDRVAQYYLLDALGCHAARSGQSRLAAQLFGAAETIRTGAGAKVIETLTPQLAQAEESTVAALGVAVFNAEFQAGRGLSRDAALRLALGESDHVDIGGSVSRGGELLGKREAEVAKLIAEGLSNKEIGARLFISQHTVDAHVRNIMNKLGFNTRAQIAAWVAAARTTTTP